MQQRQLRLGDILDDYCPRERRVTNHAVVAMIGEDVKQVRCTTCDADHEFKHGKVPRQRRKTETPAALYAQVLSNGPKRVAHEGAPANGLDNPRGSISEDADHEAAAPDEHPPDEDPIAPPVEAAAAAAVAAKLDEVPAPEAEETDAGVERDEEEGPVHRPLIRASLPRTEGQPPPVRPIPEFTIRQPGGRPNRFRPRHQRGGPGMGGGGGQQFQGNRSNGGNMHGGPPRGGMRSNGRPPQGGPSSTRLAHRHGPGRKRSK
jgi:hypothetical protein